MGGSSNPGLNLSTDYGTHGTNSYEQFSNVNPPSSPKVYPQYKGNLGRKAALFGNFENPIPAQGTFLPSDENTPFEPPKSDKGSGFAIDGGD